MIFELVTLLLTEKDAASVRLAKRGFKLVKYISKMVAGDAGCFGAILHESQHLATRNH